MRIKDEFSCVFHIQMSITASVGGNNWYEIIAFAANTNLLFMIMSNAAQ